MIRRLPSHRKSHMQRLMIGLGIGFVVLALVFVLFGLNILIAIGSWVGSFGQARDDKTVVNQQETFYGTIFVDALPDATNSAQLPVSGSVSNFGKVQYYLNDDLVKTSTIGKVESFSDIIGPLKDGKNSIEVKAIGPNNKDSKTSDVQWVLYKKSKPELEISEPGNDATVSSDDINVKGITDNNEVTIQVDGSPAVVNLNGEFSTDIRLKEGENEFEVIATDVAGNETKLIKKVTYKKE